MTIDVDEMNRRLVKLAESPNSRFWRIDYGALSPPERVFRAVWELEAEINNGGLHQYFWNSSGSLVPDAADALRTIGATTMSEIVEQAVAAVGHDIVWSDDSVRRATLAALTPEVVAMLNELTQTLLAYPDNLTTLLYNYFFEHRKEINVPSEF
jgi:Domain of unknown function (DUF4375)